uniref:CFEM6 n=1 Tax=Alternaria solani TaxID=48100 RepID=A0AA52HNH8_ALTSO|nr:CFEM6 [Alternaria solani]
MKTFTIATVVALASVGAAQLNNIPSCALNCFIGPLTSDGCSSLTDFECHCQKGAQLLSQVQPCVEGACSPSDQAAAISAVESTCAAAGVPISIPEGSAASSAVASATSAAASATSAAASAASSVASSVASEVTSILSEASSVVASAASSLSSALSDDDESTSMTATPTATGSVSTTPSSSVSEFTGGAAQATQAVGILGAAALAMFAL